MSRVCFRTTAGSLLPWLGVLALATAPAAADKPIVNVFLLAGQSNMAGADSEVPVPPGFQQTPADRATRFTALPLLEGEQSPRYVPWGEIKGHEAKGKLVHGPEVGLARSLYAAGWRDVAIIKVYANFKRDAKVWPWGERGDLFQPWTAFVDARLAEMAAQGQSTRICGFVWHQGIDDAIHGIFAGQYEQNLTNMIGVLRKRYAADDTPFVLARSVHSRIAQPRPDPETLSPMAQVRRAQVKVGGSVPGATWIDVDDLPNVNVHHFSAASQLVIGERFGEAFKKLKQTTGPAHSPAQPVALTEPLPKEDGYRGIWYFNQPTNDEYRYKYSGGFATYPQQHAPIAIYCAEVEKTFFVYGGTTARKATDKQQLLHMVAYYDHRTGQVPRPRLLLNKQTDDAHDNPTLQVDDAGHLWIFSSSHGTSRPSYIHRSIRPYSIDAFEQVSVTNFSYTQPWHVPGSGFLFLHTRYNGGRSLGSSATRCLFSLTSGDGRTWSEPRMLAGIEAGDYQISWRSGNRVATAFDYHPPPLGLNARANVYYLETADVGKTWHDVKGRPVELPLTTANNLALAYDSRADGLLVYLKDLNFDQHGRPVILLMTSKGFEPGPENGPRQWHTLRWTGAEWVRRPFTNSGNNYDHGSLYVESDGTWRVIAPTELGPQPYNPGGEMVLWTSHDEGATWKREKQLTQNSPRNHTYARRPLNAHPEFYALWADGHGREPSESFLYFTNQRGDHVWRLPAKIESELAKPEIAW